MSLSLRQKVQDNSVAMGLALMYPVAGIIECMTTGWDWLWIDGQHGQHDYRSMLECVRVAEACGVSPIVRVPGHEYGLIGPVMDMKPAGIMVPMVNNVQEALAVVRAMRFPPVGERSFGGRRVIDVGGRDYYKTANEDTVLIAQIETEEAINNAEAIAATEGVDVLFFSPDDIKLRMGIPMNTSVADSEELTAAMERVIKAAKNAGKMGGNVTPTPATIKMSTALGYSLLVGGGDVSFLREGAPAKLAALRGALKSSTSDGDIAGDQNGSLYT